jgi:antitoxin HicB
LGKEGVNMRVYTAIISEDPEDGGYLVDFPSLPGCHTYGRTLDEAQSNAKDALEGFIEALTKIGQRTLNKRRRHARR